ncbi:MAG: hypothetical protein MK161_16800 [Pirellulales bacterium]|nr:hypothetical protein [Pirellulales bacterium]
MRKALVLISSLVLTALPGWAWACAVCGSQDEKSAGAYLAMTIFLSLLPLSLIGGVGYWLWRRYHTLEGAQSQRVHDGANNDWKDLVLPPPSSTDAVSVHHPDATTYAP